MRKSSSSPNDHEQFIATIKARHTIISATRSFFDRRGYLEVHTPARVLCPGIEPYVDALPAGPGYYLATSPELHMKRLLAKGAQRIYQIAHAFRADELGPLHSPEFLMLEWYCPGIDYLGIMLETEELLAALAGCPGSQGHDWLRFPLPRMKVDDLFLKIAGWKPSVAWDEDRYFSDWVEKVDPFLSRQQALFLVDFPAALASLAKLKDADSLLCERFELFLCGVEIANAFSELTDYDAHCARLTAANQRRAQMCKEAYPVDEGFMAAVRSGIPECAGIALGLDRLIMVLLGCRHIEQVQLFNTV